MEKATKNKLIIVGGALVGVAVFLLQQQYEKKLLSTPPSDQAVSYFSQKIEQKIVQQLGAIPVSEDLTGFQIIKTFPGIAPEDFLGVTTAHGEFQVKDRQLYFFGNAPSNAAAMNEQGMKVLLQNISHRLKLPARDTEEVDTIFEFLS
jgi:hypothetical protein